jgi:serine/threonine-protein kinase
MPAAPGTLLTPSIRLLRPLGEGGMGAVWLAENVALRTQVVVKVMSELLGSDEAFAARFAREAVAAAQVRSPHSVQVFDAGVAEGIGPYIVMEHLEGEDLAERLERERVLSPEAVCALVGQTAHALARAHAKGIVHRDVKPANLFLCKGHDVDPYVKVLDFGIAKLVGEVDGATRGRMALGTPRYMAPEQATAAPDLDGRADLFALGMVAFRALTGTWALSKEGIGAAGAAALPRPTERRPELPAAVDAWFARACALRREERFQDAESMARALADALALGPAALGVAEWAKGPGTGATPSAAAATAEVRQEKPTDPPSPRRRLVAAALAALAAFALVAVLRREHAASTEGAVPAASGAPRASALASATAPADAGPAPISIPVLVGVTGVDAADGQAMLRAARAAELLVNRGGGVRGRPLRFVPHDDQGDTGAFLLGAARRAFDETAARVLLGPGTSEQARLVVPIAMERGAALVTSSATSHDLPSGEGTLLLRTSPSDLALARALARVMRDPSHPHGARECEHPAVVAADDAYGHSLSQAFDDAFRHAGGRAPRAHFVPRVAKPSYEGELAALSQEHPDCVVLATPAEVSARFLRQRDERRALLRVPTFGTDALASDELIVLGRADRSDPASPSVAEGLRGVRTAAQLPWRPEYMTFARALEEVGGGAVEPFMAAQFDGAVLIALALQVAGPEAGGAALLSAMRAVTRGGHVFGPADLGPLLQAIARGEDVDYQGASGDLDTDETGDVRADFVPWTVTKGRFVDGERLRLPP